VSPVSAPKLPPKLGKVEARELQIFWDRFFTSAKYRASLQRRILRGKAPHMEALLHHITYGKPKETRAFSGEGDGILVLQIGDNIVKAQALEDGKVKMLDVGALVLPAATPTNGGDDDAEDG
jgi:hypothetical protein